MSFGMIITHLVCIAHKFTRSRRSTRKASPASCSARTAALWNLNPSLICCVISLTNRWNGSLLISRSGPFQYFCISLRACIPHCTFLFLSFLSSLTTYICFSFWPLILRALFLFTSLVLSEAIFLSPATLAHSSVTFSEVTFIILAISINRRWTLFNLSYFSKFSSINTRWTQSKV